MAAVTSTIALSIAAASSLLSANAQADAQNQSAEFSKRMGEINTRLNEQSAETAIKRGDEAAKVALDKGDVLRGSQRAGYAAQGVNLDSGSAQEVQTQTAEMSAMDALTIKNNAALEAYGIRISGQNQKMQNDFDVISNRARAGSTLLTGGLNAATAVATGYDRGVTRNTKGA